MARLEQLRREIVCTAAQLWAHAGELPPEPERVLFLPIALGGMSVSDTVLFGPTYAVHIIAYSNSGSKRKACQDECGAAHCE